MGAISDNVGDFITQNTAEHQKGMDAQFPRRMKKSLGLDYAERRRRQTPHRVSKPIPKSVTEAGSGAAPGGSVTVTV